MGSSSLSDTLEPHSKLAINTNSIIIAYPDDIAMAYIVNVPTNPLWLEAGNAQMPIMV